MPNSSPSDEIDFTPFDDASASSTDEIPFYSAADLTKFSLGQALNNPLWGLLNAGQYSALTPQERTLERIPIPENLRGTGSPQAQLPADVVGGVPQELLPQIHREQAPSLLSQFWGGLGSAAGQLGKTAGVVGEFLPQSPEFEGIELNEPPQMQQYLEERRARTMPQIIRAAEASPVFQAGETAQQYWQQAIPPGRDFLSQAARMGGELVPLALSGPFAPAEIGITAFSEHLVNDYEDAIKQGVPENEAAAKAMDKAMLSGGIQGAIFAVLPPALRKLGDKYLIDKFGSEASKWIARRVAQGGEGAVLGAAATVPENIISGRPVGENVLPAALGFGALGAITPRGLTEREYASRIREAEKVYGDLRSRALEGPGQVPAEEGSQRFFTSPEAVAEAAQVPLTLNDPSNLLNPIQTQALHDASQSLGLGGDVTVVPTAGEYYKNPDFDAQHRLVAWADYPKVDADGNFVSPGKVFVSKAAMDKLYQIADPSKRQAIVRRIFQEEVIHSFTTKKEAIAFLGTLTDVEKNALFKLYWGDSIPENMTPGQEGSEAIRIVLTRLAGDDPTEVGWHSGIAKIKPRMVELFATIIRRVREFFGTKAATQGREIMNTILDRMEQNTNKAAKSAGIEAPFPEVRASRLPEEERGGEELPEILPGERLVTVQRPDGSTYTASFGDKYWELGQGKTASIGRPVAGNWSHGMLRPGEKIIERGAPEVRAARRPQTTEEEIDKSTYDKLSSVAENVSKQWQGGKVEKKALDFDKFYKALQKDVGQMDRNTALSAYEQGLWRLLLNASGGKLEAIVRSEELLKEVGDKPIGDPAPRSKVGAAEETPEQRKGRVARDRRRGVAISAIARKLLSEAVERGEERKTQVEPTDLYKSKRKTTRGTTEELKQPIYNELGNVQGVSPDKLGQVLTDDAGDASRRTVSETRRVTVIQNKATGKVDVVSTFRDGRRGPVMLDPMSPDQSHSKVESMLKRYQPVASILLDKPVKNFRQSYDSLADYENQFGKPAREGASKPVAELPGEAPIEGAYSRAVPITDAEAGALLDHMLSESGKIESPADVKASLDAIGDTIAHHEAQLRQAYKVVSPELPLSPGARMALNAYRKLAQQLEKVNPPGTSAEEIIDQLANNLYEAHKTSGSYEDFVRNVLAQGGPEASQAAATRPQAAKVPTAAPTAAPRAARIPTRIAEAVRSKQTNPETPGIVEFFRSLQGYPGRNTAAILSLIKGFAGETMPLTTRANRLAGEAGARYGASRDAARHLAAVFSSRALEGTNVDPIKFGTALVEDNLRSIHSEYQAKAADALLKGDHDNYQKLTDKADNVATLIGAKGSPFASEGEYQAYLNDPAFQQAVANHIKQWNDIIDPMYKQAMSMDASLQLPSRGIQTGARINLKAILEDTEAVKSVRGVGRGPNLTATFKRKSPFGREATGAGEKYEVDYHELIANTFGKQSEIANKNVFDDSLVKAGLAVIDEPGQTVMLGSIPTEAFPLKRRVVITDKDGTVRTFAKNENIYVRKDLANEYRIVADVDKPFKIPVVTPAMNALNRIALAGLTDFTVHGSNLLTGLFNRPVSGPLLIDTLLSTFYRADVPVTLVRTIIKTLGSHPEQLSELATIAALRPNVHHAGIMGRILRWGDTTTRLMLDDTYNRLVKAGILENSETERREYVNGVGQYQRRLQGMFTRLARDIGFGPFITAGKTFPALGIKMGTLSPGAKSTGAFAEAALRANILSKWVGGLLILGTLSYLNTKDKGGGVLGRPGVPIGNLDTGKTDKQGRPLSIPFLDLIGLGRVLRFTGLRGALTAKRLGLTNQQAMDAAFRDVVNSAVAPVAGPAVRFGSVAVTGYAPAKDVPRVSRVAAPGQNQILLNIREAAKDANPVVKSYLDWKEGKTPQEALAGQIPRFTMQPGKSTAYAQKYPEIVNRAQLRAYTDDVARQVRQIPIKERLDFVKKRFTEDGLSKQNFYQGIELLERKGVFSYQ